MAIERYILTEYVQGGVEWTLGMCIRSVQFEQDLVNLIQYQLLVQELQPILREKINHILFNFVIF